MGKDQFVGKWKGKGVNTNFIGGQHESSRSKSRVTIKLIAYNTYSIKLSLSCTKQSPISFNGFVSKGQLFANASDGNGVNVFYFVNGKLRHGYTSGTNVKSQVANYKLKKCN